MIAGVAATFGRSDLGTGPAATGTNTRAVEEAGQTPRELDILRLLSQGRSNGEIGTTLFISGRTVSTHVSNILGKLGVSTRTEAATWAVRSGVLSGDRAG